MLIDALVPCYNEAPRLTGVLKVLNASTLIHKIIFVDGGSTDNSIEAAQKFPKVEILALGRKGGKGQDVKEGLKKVTTPAVFLCDADLSGLTQKHVGKMIELYQKNPQGLVVGLTQKSPHYFVHWLRANLLPTISGMRVVSKQHLEKVLSHPLSQDWGIEVYMNYYFAKQGKPLTKLLLEGVNDPHKPAKAGYGWRPHLAEAYSVLQKYILVYAKELPTDLYNGLKSFIFPSSPKDKSHYSTFSKEINGVKINFARVGRGPILVFVHGWANNWEGWKPVIPDLKNKFSLYLLDLPGFGDSDSLPEYSVLVLSDWLYKFTRLLPQKPKALVALSLGTLIAAETLKNHPETAASMILIGPPLKSGRRGWVAKTLRYSFWFLKNIKIGERALKKIVETRLAAYAVSKYVNMYRFNRFLVDAYGLIGKKKMRKEAFTQMGISGAVYDLKSVLEKTPVRTLLLYGREDKISSPKDAQKELLPKNTNLACVDIPEAGHVVAWEKPREVAAEIKKFLNN